MGRSGYTDDIDTDNPSYLLWPSVVKRAIKGKRGQEFLKELARALDAMPEKALIAGELVSKEGDCCAIGAVLKARNVDVKDVDYTDRDEVAKLINVAPCMAAQIAYMNDDDFGYEQRDPGEYGKRKRETPEERWLRIRKWVGDSLVQP